VAKNTNWQLGKLGVEEDAAALVKGCDAVVHGEFDRPGRGFRGTE
jgi:hypothetical protein